MRRSSLGLVVLGACAVSRAAHADLPNTAPIYGAESLDSVGATLDQSVSEHGQNDSRSEAERRLRENGDATSIVVGSTATSLGATLFVGGIALGSSLDWKSPDCPACLSSLVLATFGFQLALVGLIGFADYGSDHAGRGHARRVRALVLAMSHPSLEAARAARCSRTSDAGDYSQWASHAQSAPPRCRHALWATRQRFPPDSSSAASNHPLTPKAQK